jgi:iron complex transport system substrate-binding protein
MKRPTIALWILIAIPLASTAGYLVAYYLPLLQAAATKPVDKRAPGPIRIVSLSPSTTEMVFLLGMGDSLVGVTDYCNYPPEAKQIERVGGFGKPSVEKLLALAPDLVVASGFNRSNVLPILQQAGIRSLDVKVNSIDDMFQALRDIGDAVGKRQRADQAVASMQAELRAVAAQLPDAKKSPPPRVFVELWDDPLDTIGGGSFLDDVIARAGGLNVAHDLPQPHVRISAEKVIEWDPDVIIIAHMARNPGSAAKIGQRIGWSDLKAVKQDRVLCDVPGDLILRPGPRLIEGVKLLAKRLRK